jgi:hypothetical protein
MLTIADFPPLLPTDLSTVFSLISGPTVAFIASTPNGPGLSSCLERLDARDRLDGCLMMERVLGLGPLGELVAQLMELGIDPGIGAEADTLLDQPRNRNPAVEQFRVSFGDQDALVPAGTSVVVPRDQAIVLTVETAAEDLDGYETQVGDETVLFTDDLEAQWWFDREVDVEDTPAGEPWVRLRAGAATGTVRAYAVLRDSRSGEGWGFVDLELGG